MDQETLPGRGAGDAMNLDALAEKLLADIRLCDSRDEFDEVVRAALAQAYANGQEDMRERAKIAVNRSASKAEAELSVESLEVKP